MTIDEQFHSLNDKINLLLKQHVRVNRDNLRLLEELTALRRSEAAAKQRVEELEQQMAIMKSSLGELSEKDKKAFEKKINLYIKEVDRCISFLSQ